MTQLQKKDDPLFRIKYLGYCLSQLESGKITFEDYVRYAKFQLCIKTHKLLKDPIWDLYTSEEILIEFFAHQFEINKKFLEDFETSLNNSKSNINDFGDWAEQEIAKQKRQFEKTLEGMEERISFNPATDIIGGIE